MTINVIDYSFKIFPRFRLAKSSPIIHHNQLLMTKFCVKWTDDQKTTKVEGGGGGLGCGLRLPNISFTPLWIFWIQILRTWLPRSLEQASFTVTTEECILYFLHHKNGRLALESTRKPKVCPDKCHLDRTSSKLSPGTFYRADLLPLGIRGWASRERGDLSFS